MRHLLRRAFHGRGLLIIGAALLAAPASWAVAQSAADTPQADAPVAASEDAAPVPEAARPLLSLHPGELEVLRSLAERRRALDAREAEIYEREQLAKAFEERLSEETKSIRTLQASLKEQEAKLAAEKETVSAAEAERYQRLAKAYKSMKPRDAARLFDDLDLELLTAIAREISPRVLAPVMAKMKPEKARALTEALTSG